MKKHLLCLFLALATVVSMLPMLVTAGAVDSVGADGENGAGASVTLVTPDELYVPGAKLFLSAYKGQDGLTVNADGSATWVDSVTGQSVALNGGAKNLVGAYTLTHVSGVNAEELAVTSTKIHYAEDGVTEALRVTLKIYTSSALSADNSAYKNYLLTSDAGAKVVACRSELTVEAKDGSGNWSADPSLATYEFGGWTEGENGGIGYSLPDFFFGDRSILPAHNITPDPAFLPEGALTVEIVTSIVGATDTDNFGATLSKYTVYEGDGEWTPAYRIGAFVIAPRVTSTASPNLKPGMGKVNILYNNNGYTSDGVRIVDAQSPMAGLTYGSSIVLTKAAVGGGFKYELSMSGASIASYTASASSYIANSQLEDPAGILRLAYNLPQTVYAIRVYDFALTADQLAQNRFADLASFYGLDFSAFSAMPETYRQDIYNYMSSFDFSQSKADVQKALDDAIDAVTYVPEMNEYDRLYVQNGLTVLLTAYDHSEKAVSLSNGGGTWINKIAGSDGAHAKFSLVGTEQSFEYLNADGVLYSGNTGWHLIEGAGIGYEATLKQMQSGLNNYVDLGMDSLPASYTVEMIFDPRGANLDGTETYRSSGVAERWNYIVTAGNIGIYSKHTVSANSGLEYAPLDSFYVSYQEDGLWNPNGTGSGYKVVGEIYDMNLNDAGAVNLTVVRQEGTDSVKSGIAVYSGARTLASAMGDFSPLASRGSKFQLMRETPGVLYSVRVYDRVLSDAERAQNHFADLCAFYKLDLSDFNNETILPEPLRQDLYTRMLDVGFDSTAEKVQERLRGEIYSSLISFDGYAVKTEGAGEELSAIFTVNNERINSLIELGYTVTYGGILAGADVPDEQMVYSADADGIYVYILFSNDGGVTATPVFLSTSAEKNRFGLSVYYDAVTSPENYGKLYRFRSFAVLEKDGERTVAYMDAKTEGLGSAVSHYSVAEYLATSDKYVENRKLLTSLDKSFYNYDIYVDAERGADTNSGSKSSPLKTVEKALALALELINTEAMPAVNIYLAGGTYELSETLTVDKTKITADNYRLSFKKAAGAEAPTISGALDVAGSEFQLYDAEKNIYVYMLPDSMKDANGSYPIFQNFYVDGKMATLAESDWFVMKHDEYLTDDGHFVVWVPAELLEGVVAKDADGKYYLCSGFPDTMRWATRMQWYYYDLVIEGIDIDTSNTVDRIPDLRRSGNGFSPCGTYTSTEGYVALRFYSDHGTVFNRSHMSVNTFSFNYGPNQGNNPYTAKLTGSIAFLDEGGEFYYDELHGVFYYIPTEGQTVSELTFSLPMLETLVSLDDVKNVSFEDIVFTGTDTKYIPQYGFTGGQAGSQKRGNPVFIHEGAIVGKNVAGITVKNCSFVELYYHGVDFYGSNNKITIDSCVFERTGGGAIQLGDGIYTLTNNNSNVRITNNYLNENGIIFYNNCAVTITCVKNCKILFNTVTNSAYTGISVGWSWQQTSAPVGTFFNVFNCEIAYNYVENFMWLMKDGGAIYTLGGNAPIEYAEYDLNELHDNYIYCGSSTGHESNDVFSAALYHDGGSSHWYTHHNVIWVDQNILSRYDYISFQEGSANDSGTQAYRITAENNYFINLYQKYLTLGYQRVRTDWELYEINSYLLTTLLPDEFEDAYESPIGKWHAVSKNPANWAPFYMSGKIEEMDWIMSNAGCDLSGGIHKGVALGDLAYDYHYRLLTHNETWYEPGSDNPNYPDR